MIDWRQDSTSFIEILPPNLASGSPWGKGLGAQFHLKGNLAGMKYGAEIGYFGKESGTTTGSTPAGPVWWQVCVGVGIKERETDG